MRSIFIPLAAVYFLTLGCVKNEPDYWMRGSGPEHVDREVETILSDPFDNSVLAEALEIAGLEIEFVDRPPRGGGHFVHLVRTMRGSNTNEYTVLASITSNWPEAKYASPDILQISLHTVPDGTPLRDSKDLRIRVLHDAASYTLGQGRGGGSATSKRNISISNPFYGSYQGDFQYGPIIKSKHDDGITILLSESIEYRIVMIASDPYSKNSSEPDDADNPVKSPENSKNQPDD